MLLQGIFYHSENQVYYKVPSLNRVRSASKDASTRLVRNRVSALKHD